MELKWSNDTNKKGLASKIKEKFQSKEPIKPRLEEARRTLQMQIAKLDAIYAKINSKDKILFSKVVKCIQNRDMESATILSNELVHLRKLEKMVNGVKLALEQINIRMGTMSELGDIVVTLSPAMSVINNIKRDITTMIPEVSNEINELSNGMTELFINSSSIPTFNNLPNIVDNDEELQKILEEATMVVENDVRRKLPEPELPSMDMSSKPSFKSSNPRRYPDLPSTRSKKRVDIPV